MSFIRLNTTTTPGDFIGLDADPIQEDATASKPGQNSRHLRAMSVYA
jgi:hypothetical protein